MRVAFLALIVVAACSRRVEHNVRPIEAPSSRGGGPPATLGADDARRRIAEARCSHARVCGEDREEIDACRTRVEAENKLDCEIDRARLDACVEAIREATCSDFTAPEECAHVCKEDGQ